MPNSTSFLPAQVLTLPEGMNREDEVAVLEATWWQLNPGDPGYDVPLHQYCGFTEQEWRARRVVTGFRR